MQADRFTLDYGDGFVIVEMDDGDRDADAYKLIKGDKVTVNGRVDDDFFELTTIEAGSVYVEKSRHDLFCQQSRRGVPWRTGRANLLPPIAIPHIIVSGTVSEVNAHEFVLDTDKRMVRVDVSHMAFDPLDEEGYLKIDEGDRVKVFGEIISLFEGRELEAETIIELSQS